MKERWPNPPYGTVEYRDMTPVGRSSVVLYTFEDKKVGDVLVDEHHPLYDAWAFVETVRVYVGNELNAAGDAIDPAAHALTKLKSKVTARAAGTITLAVKFFLAP